MEAQIATGILRAEIKGRRKRSRSVVKRMHGAGAGEVLEQRPRQDKQVSPRLIMNERGRCGRYQRKYKGKPGLSRWE